MVHPGAAERVPDVDPAAALLHPALCQPITPGLGLGRDSRRGGRLVPAQSRPCLSRLPGVFAQQRRREARRAVALTVALVLAMLTLPPVHNRYYGGPNLEAWPVANVNRAALAIAPSRLAQLHRDPALLEELREQLWRSPKPARDSRGPAAARALLAARDAGLQWALGGDGDRRAVAAPPRGRHEGADPGPAPLLRGPVALRRGAVLPATHRRGSSRPGSQRPLRDRAGLDWVLGSGTASRPGSLAPRSRNTTDISRTSAAIQGIVVLLFTIVRGRFAPARSWLSACGLEGASGRDVERLESRPEDFRRPDFPDEPGEEGAALAPLFVTVTLMELARTCTVVSRRDAVHGAGHG